MTGVLCRTYGAITVAAIRLRLRFLTSQHARGTRPGYWLSGTLCSSAKARRLAPRRVGGWAGGGVVAVRPGDEFHTAGPLISLRHDAGTVTRTR